MYSSLVARMLALFSQDTFSSAPSFADSCAIHVASRHVPQSKAGFGSCDSSSILIAFGDMTTRRHRVARSLRLLQGAFCLFHLVSVANADTAYYRHVLFDNSLESDAYYYSEAKASPPSTIERERDKLPVSRDVFLTPPNALRLKWRSVEAGGWEATVRVIAFRNREIVFRGDTLYFWCYSQEGIAGRNLPAMRLQDTGENFSVPLDPGKFVKEIPARKWTRVGIRLDQFKTGSIHNFEAKRTAKIVFGQNAPDGVEHSLIIDDIVIDDGGAAGDGNSGIAALPTPQDVSAKGYERHVDVYWDAVVSPELRRYVVYRSLQGGEFEAVGIAPPGINRFTDFLGKPGLSARYKVAAADKEYRLSAFSNEASATTRPMSDDELLTMLQEACFRYYWEGAHPQAGMTLENIPGDDRIVATGASGFGIMALVVGVDRGFISREQGLERLRKIVTFLERAPRYHGVWSHFMDGDTGQSLPVFDMFDNAGDVVETAFLMQGLLAARQYFRGTSEPERNLYARISHLWETVEWDWYRRSPQSDALYWHWSPEWSWYISHRLTGFNETMIVYLLAIASPTHAVPAALYYSGWANQGEVGASYRRGWSGVSDGERYTNGNSYYGIKLPVGVASGGPLFFTQYSYMAFDPRIHDRFADYFQNNRDIARINLAYCVENPGHYAGYGADFWGLTASDGPKGYVPREPRRAFDDGTMAFTGAFASFPYTPEPSLAMLKHVYRDLGDRVWGVYGPRDAINLSQDWVSPIFMGLNQAPITVMIENYRTGLVWKLFMSNPEIQPMLQQIGFEPDAAQQKPPAAGREQSAALRRGVWQMNFGWIGEGNRP